MLTYEMLGHPDDIDQLHMAVQLLAEYCAAHKLFSTHRPLSAQCSNKDGGEALT